MSPGLLVWKVLGMIIPQTFLHSFKSWRFFEGQTVTRSCSKKKKMLNNSFCRQSPVKQSLCPSANVICKIQHISFKNGNGIFFFFFANPSTFIIMKKSKDSDFLWLKGAFARHKWEWRRLWNGGSGPLRRLVWNFHGRIEKNHIAW